jgi:hypothetical protein
MMAKLVVATAGYLVGSKSESGAAAIPSKGRKVPRFTIALVARLGASAGIPSYLIGIGPSVGSFMVADDKGDSQIYDFYSFETDWSLPAALAGPSSVTAIPNRHCGVGDFSGYVLWKYVNAPQKSLRSSMTWITGQAGLEVDTTGWNVTLPAAGVSHCILLRHGAPLSTIGKSPWPRFNATVGVWRPLMPYHKRQTAKLNVPTNAFWRYFNLLLDSARPSLEENPIWHWSWHPLAGKPPAVLRPPQSGLWGMDSQGTEAVLVFESGDEFCRLRTAASVTEGLIDVVGDQEGLVHYLPGESNGTINEEFDIFWVMTGRQAFEG